MNNDGTTPNHQPPHAACEAVTAQIAAGQHQAAWEALKTLARTYPSHAPVYRLQGGILQQAGEWELALNCFQQALALDATDIQAQAGAARCLLTLGRLPEARVHFREALRYQCEQLKQANIPPSPVMFDHQAAERTLWQVLAQLAAAGVQAFPTSGTLLGLTREGQLLPFDKDLDIGLPFTQMDAAAACLEAQGWKRRVHIQGLVNPQEWHHQGVALDLCGFMPEPATGRLLSGFWFEGPEHPWSRVTEFNDFTLQPLDTAYGQVWQPAEPEAILVPLYGPDWRVPDPDFDTVIGAHNLRSGSLLTECYALARTLNTWIMGQHKKTRSLLGHALRHLPDDPLLQQAAVILGLEGTPSTPAQVQTPTPPSLPPANRAPRILWANAYCLLDTSSGASMAVRQLLLQLKQTGCDISILGATVFDHPQGNARVREHWELLQSQMGQWVNVEDGRLSHRLLVTADTQRRRMQSYEEGLWFNGFVAELERFQPDLVLFYGGQVLDMLMTSEARNRNIAVAAFLCNGNFSGQRWCQDVDLILTDSQATARHYAEQDNLTIMPTGAFIDPALILAQAHQRQRVLFVNPSLQKGAALVCRLALLLEQSRPDILFEVVESRGDWAQLVRTVTGQLGQSRDQLNNVVVTPNTPDMRPVYGRARVLLAPSLWHESFGRVAAEAVLNHIPVLYTNCGGLPEVVGKAGLAIHLPEEAHQAPYTWLPEPEGLAPLAAVIERLFDNEAEYQALVDAARQQAPRHSLEANTRTLSRLLQPLFMPRGAAIPHVPEAAPDRPRPRVVPLTPATGGDRPRSTERRILVNSFVGRFSSMGRVGEALLRHLQEHTDHPVTLLPFQSDPAACDWPDWVARCVDYRPERSHFDQQIKFCSVREARQRRLAQEVTPWFFHDVDGLPAEYVDAVNSNDRVYVCSHFVQDVFKRHDVTVPIEVLGHGFDPDLYTFEPRQLGEVFTFLCIAEHLPRKNLPMLIRAFKRAFAPGTPVRLHLKTGLHDASELRPLMGDDRRILLDTRLRANEVEMVQLYHQADCFVLPTRIEGFGMPILEAMATGLPVIVTDYSGHLDFCHHDNALLIQNKGRVPADTSGFPHISGLWADPDEDHLITLMQQVVDDYGLALNVGRRGYEHVHSAWTWSAQLGKIFN